jgi:hemoglobin/transferrin/lactoferrin receptor protein
MRTIRNSITNNNDSPGCALLSPFASHFPNHPQASTMSIPHTHHATHHTTTRRNTTLALTPLALALCVAWAPGPAAAQAAAPSAAAETLDPITVKADRGQDTNTVVRRKRIEVEQAVGVQDLFRQTPEVSSSGALPVAQKLYVRGLGERMLTITIDGAAQPESAYHHTGQVMIEPELLKRVEVEAGTGAATAGPGALAGALRFTTKNALDMLKKDERAGGLLKASYFSASEGRKLSATAFGRISDEVDLLFNATDLDANDYTDGNGNKVGNSATVLKGNFFKMGFGITPEQRLELSHEARYDEGLRNRRTNLITAPFNATERQRSNRYSTTLSHGYRPADNPLVDLRVTAFSNTNAIRLAQDRPTAERHGTRGTGLSVANISRWGDHRLSYGLDVRRDKGFSELASGTMPHEVADVRGLHVQDDMALGQHFMVGLGLRHDSYSYTDIAGQHYASSGASPSASMSFMPTPALTFTLSHARALRGVGVIEPYLKQHQDNAASISPEKARNTELSATWKSGPWQTTAAVYQQVIQNYIGYDSFRENLGDVKSKGYSASAGYRTERWVASLGVAEARPELNGVPLADGDSLLLGNTTGRTWVAQWDHQLPAINLSLGWTARLVQDLTHVPAGTASKPGYSVHDAYARWLPLGHEDLALTLTLKNLFDRAYYEQGSFAYHPRWGRVAGLPEQGRDVRVSLAWRF